MPWPEYFIVREMGETFEELAMHLRVAISHTSAAGTRELQIAHAVLLKLRKQYAALEEVLRETETLQLPSPSPGDKVIGDVQEQLEALAAKIQRVESAMPKPKRRPRRKKAT